MKDFLETGELMLCIVGLLFSFTAQCSSDTIFPCCRAGAAHGDGCYFAEDPASLFPSQSCFCIKNNKPNFAGIALAMGIKSDEASTDYVFLHSLINMACMIRRSKPTIACTPCSFPTHTGTPTSASSTCWYVGFSWGMVSSFRVAEKHLHFSPKPGESSSTSQG
jgi:hypothetical protein